MDGITIITTADGSHSLFNKELNETYHSVHGAIQESQYVFIQQGLEFLVNNTAKKQVRLLEIGFGTGLNAFLSARSAAHLGITIQYESWEKFPIGSDLYEHLNYAGDTDSKLLFQQLHRLPWNLQVAVSETFSIEKRNADLLIDHVPEDAFDLVYYDAFAPSKQPEMWTQEILKKSVDALSIGGNWVTYCAKGQVKRDLKSLGLVVTSLTGPPGKREMLRATK
jgi:tRNA U34 5-methylaminomethyl-2-thiouridine-forming methyltransferase MnmC